MSDFSNSLTIINDCQSSLKKMIKIVDDFSKRNTNEKKDDDGQESRNRDNNTHTTNDSKDEEKDDENEDTTPKSKDIDRDEYEFLTNLATILDSDQNKRLVSSRSVTIRVIRTLFCCLFVCLFVGFMLIY